MSNTLMSVSLGYYLLTEEQVNQYCASQEKKSGRPHRWECLSDGRCEIFIQLPEGTVQEKDLLIPSEFTTFYLSNGERVDYHEKDVDKAKILAFGPSGKYKIKHLVRTVRGLDYSFHFDYKNRIWIRGSKVQYH